MLTLREVIASYGGIISKRLIRMDKVNFAMNAQRWSRGIALLFLQPQRQMGWLVNATPQPLYTRETDPIPIV
jgi:hypothetical protein